MESLNVGGMNWTKFEHIAPKGTRIVVGGKRFTDTDNWPHFNDEALKYLGTVFVPFALAPSDEDLSAFEVSDADWSLSSTNMSGRPLHIFIGSTEVESWVVEGGGNCVTIDGKFPEWITTKKVDTDIESLYFCEEQFSTTDSLAEPDWLQGDETPEGFNFVAQIPSQVDGGELINIGDGYGTAYIFVNDDLSAARVLWQS